MAKNKDITENGLNHDQEIDKNPLTVPKGQLTFDAEGNDDSESIYFSRKAHWPKGISGVTIGRGYDLGHRGSRSLITKEFSQAGIDIIPFDGAIGLKGNDAKQWLNKNADKLPIITHQQQKILFSKTYETIEEDTKRIATKESVTRKYGPTDWTNLLVPIKEVLVDLRYRGDYTTSSREIIQKSVADNDLSTFRDLLSDRANWGNVPQDRFNRRKKFLDQYPSSNIYVVQKGETISQIAKKFGVSESELIDANSQLVHGDKTKYFYEGAKINIPLT